MTYLSQNKRNNPTRVQALLSDEESARSTTRELVGTLESAAVLFQAVTIGFSAVVDPYIPPGRVIVAGLAIFHLAAAYVVFRTVGPFARGGYWVGAWIGLAFILPALTASLIEPGRYAVNMISSPLNNYAVGPVLIAAFYPWISLERPAFRWAVEALLLTLFGLEPFVLVMIFNSNPQQVSYLNATLSFVWVLLAYVLGKAVGRMCRTAARRQTEIQQQSYDEFFNFLHSHVKAGVAAVRAEWGSDAAMREKLNELEQAVSDHRIKLLLARQQVPLAALISERIRAFSGRIKIKESPRVGAMTVPRPVGILMSRALGDLMTNAALHGGSSVAVRLNPDTTGLVLDVIDDGPGFDHSVVLYDESKSLFRLRRDIDEFGGGLTVGSVESGGTHVRIFVPIQSSSNRKVRHESTAR